VAATRQEIGGEPLDTSFWEELRDLRHEFFTLNPGQALWRLSLPANTPPLALDECHSQMLYDWAGCQRFIKTTLDGDTLRRACAAAGGHATCYTPAEQGGNNAPFTPLDPVVEKYHRRLKEQLDTRGIFNPGRLYAAL
jgi:glycolate oxidase FAD binding subunit